MIRKDAGCLLHIIIVEYTPNSILIIEAPILDPNPYLGPRKTRLVNEKRMFKLLLDREGLGLKALNPRPKTLNY